MTKAHSEPGDNAGRCEYCQKDDDGGQSTVPVFLDGGLGMSTMWMCVRCLIEHAKKFLKQQAENDQRGITRK